MIQVIRLNNYRVNYIFFVESRVFNIGTNIRIRFDDQSQIFIFFFEFSSNFFEEYFFYSIYDYCFNVMFSRNYCELNSINKLSRWSISQESGLEKYRKRSVLEKNRYSISRQLINRFDSMRRLFCHSLERIKLQPG